MASRLRGEGRVKGLELRGLHAIARPAQESTERGDHLVEGLVGVAPEHAPARPFHVPDDALAGWVFPVPGSPVSAITPRASGGRRRGSAEGRSCAKGKGRRDPDRRIPFMERAPWSPSSVSYMCLDPAPDRPARARAPRLGTPPCRRDPRGERAGAGDLPHDAWRPRGSSPRRPESGRQVPHGASRPAPRRVSRGRRFALRSWERARPPAFAHDHRTLVGVEADADVGPERPTRTGDRGWLRSASPRPKRRAG